MAHVSLLASACGPAGGGDSGVGGSADGGEAGQGEADDDESGPGDESGSQGGTASAGDSDESDDSDDSDDASGDDDADTGTGDAKFTIQSELSAKIGTVGIVTWSVDLNGLNGLESAHIEFGLDSNYGLVAPVDLDAPEYRTLLLGMKPSRSYHFRIVANAGGESFASRDQTIDTQAFPNQLALPTMSTPLPDRLQPGFTLTSLANNGEAIIMDDDGEFVWWYLSDLELVSRVRMSRDGRYMWIRDGNAQHTSGHIVRVTMDGLDEKSWTLDGSHHDLVPLPEGGVAFIQTNGQCDDIVEMTDDGTMKTVYEIAGGVMSSGSGQCQVNSLHYDVKDDAYTFGLRDWGLLAKVSRGGELKWILGGKASDFPGVSWDKGVQHGHHIIDGGLLLFNNADASISPALEYTIDEAAGTAQRVWEYKGEYGSIWLGDVQRLANGNTLITYSSDGVMQEVTAKGELVQQRAWGLGAGLGYTMRRDDLYGLPPK